MKKIQRDQLISCRHTWTLLHTKLVHTTDALYA